MNVCAIATCTNGTCDTTPIDAGTALADATKGDCHHDECDGNGGITSVVDDGDVPDDDNPCTKDSCDSGTPQHDPEDPGTSCGTDLVCDGSGVCVGCLGASDCPAGANACQVAVCNSGFCGYAPAAAGDLPGAQQTAGDCQKLTCDGTTQAPVSVADNGDLPADDANQCTSEACSGGVPAHPPVNAGAACSQNGGNVCDGNGACTSSVPTVTSTTPADAGAAAASTTIAITFSEAMKEATLTGQTSLGTCTGSIQVSANDFASCVAFSSAAPAMDGAKKVATFTAQPGLLINRTYKIRVTTAAQSAFGVALGAQYTSATGFATTNPLPAGSGVVISQVYGGGSETGGQYTNDYVVLHNRGAASVNLGTMSLQYTSDTGTGWGSNKLNLTGTIAAGGYFLVQLGKGSVSGGAPLPTPDQTWGQNIGAAKGKIALVNSTAGMGTNKCPDPAMVIDFVGFGTSADCAEGTVAPAPSNATAVFRKMNACADTNDNGADFVTGTPAPRNSESPAFLCSPAQNESDSLLEVDFCATHYPLALEVPAGSSQTVWGRLFVFGITESARPCRPT